MQVHSIDVEVNGHSVKAFVDSGAQQTISETPSHSYTSSRLHLAVSPECAEACG
jgi:hypothetical protein